MISPVPSAAGRTSAASPGLVQDAVVQAEISEVPLSIDAVVDVVRSPSVGAIAVFLGVVRDHDHDQAVSGLEYQSHPNAQPELAASAARAVAGRDVTAVAVRHRVGSLAVGDLAVVVAVGAAHRAPALEACRFLIDDLKQHVPIWKRQRFLSGDYEWVGL